MFTPTGQETPEDLDDRVAELKAVAAHQPRRLFRLASELALLTDSFAERMARGTELLHAESDVTMRLAITNKIVRMEEARSRALAAIADAFWGQDLDEMRLAAAKAVFGAQEVPGGPG